MERLTSLYEAYFARVAQAEKTYKPTDGMFGLRGGISYDPCHNQFAEDLEVLLGEIAAQGDPKQAYAALDYIYRASEIHRDANQTVYWMLIAVHSLTHPLIELLTRADALTLWQWYGKAFPRRQSLPNQKKVLDALRARSHT